MQRNLLSRLLHPSTCIFPGCRMQTYLQTLSAHNLLLVQWLCLGNIPVKTKYPKMGPWAANNLQWLAMLSNHSIPSPTSLNCTASHFFSSHCTAAATSDPRTSEPTYRHNVHSSCVRMLARKLWQCMPWEKRYQGTWPAWLGGGGNQLPCEGPIIRTTCNLGTANDSQTGMRSYHITLWTALQALSSVPCHKPCLADTCLCPLLSGPHSSAFFRPANTAILD